MPYYNLERLQDGAIFSEIASTDDDALALFGRKLKLSDEYVLGFDGDGPCDFLFQRRDQSRGWVRPDIPVYLNRRT